MEIIKNLHSYLAYVVLAVLIVAVINALLGWLGKKDFTMHKDLRISLFALILSHIQLLVGLVLYFISANGLKAFINIIALALITIGWSRHKKFMESDKKFKTISIFYGLGLLLILSRIPWGQWFA